MKLSMKVMQSSQKPQMDSEITTSSILWQTPWSKMIYILLEIVPFGGSVQHSSHFVSASCDPV